MTTKDEALRIALEALESSKQLVEISLNQAIARELSDVTVFERSNALAKHEAAIAAIKQAQQPTDSTCNETLRLQGKAYPRTCKKCRLGPCIGKPVEQAQQAQEPEGPDHEDGPDEDGFRGPRPWNSYAAPKQAEPNCRIELVGAIQGLASHYENRLHRLDPEDRKLAEGDIAHAMKIAAKWNWNGTSPTPPEAK